MTRIRSLVAISALTGATVLGGAGLAGATAGSTDTDADKDAIELTQVESEVVTTVEDEDTTDDRSTGEADWPEAPTLPDQAAQQAHDALAERFAGGTSEDGDTKDDGDDTAVTAEEEATEDDGSHGERVSDVATSGSGEGHGEEVSTVAKQQGEERRAAAQENRPERDGGTEDGKADEADDEDDKDDLEDDES
jgi:hypothetical protein